MKDKSLVWHTILAVAATVWALVVWRAPASSLTDRDVVVVSSPADQLTEIGWHEERYDVTVKRDAAGSTVTVLRRPAEPKEGEADAKPETYPGTKEADGLFSQMAPLKGTRSLGEVTPDQMHELGFEKPAASLTLRFGEVEHTLDVGKSTYGTGDLYIRSADGRVHLLRSNTVSKLRYGGSALLDRGVWGVDCASVQRAVIQHGSEQREVLHRHADDGENAFFADPAEPDTKLEKLDGWLDRILRLRVTSVGEGSGPKEPPTFTVELFDSEQSLGKLSLWDPGEAQRAAALSTRFSSAVWLARASVTSLLRDLNDVMREGK